MKLETRKIPESEPEMVEIRYHWITDEIQEIISFGGGSFLRRVGG